VFGFSTEVREYSSFTELELLTIVPLVFGLLPARAVVREKPDDRIKPHIIEHLRSLAVDHDEELIDVLKSIADQYYATQPPESRFIDGERGTQPVRPTRKFGISDVKAANYSRYRLLLERQAGRCAICGIPFNESATEELDHILPWRLVGDIPDGSNWQV